MPTTGGHEFGGSWTQLKLDAIADYLTFYNGALQYKPRRESPFKRWYIDAFAGSGDRVEKEIVGGLFEGRLSEIKEVTREGSARRAIAINPPFDYLIFVERNASRFQSLCRLKSEFPQRKIECRQGDANDELLRIFEKPPWSNQIKGRGPHRAVVFLDPYAMHVKWHTLQVLAETAAVDVWYLFPLGAVVRQLARDYDAVDKAKRLALNEIFGTADWQSELYRHEVATDLFNQPVEWTHRRATKAQIEAYARSRLATLFSYVSDPLPLLTDRGAQLFSLFCASGTDSKLAKPLIEKGVRAVLKKYGQASHRRSGP